jgi:exopolysaccharide biosynthesis WecB/TagA/CpsF family protein
MDAVSGRRVPLLGLACDDLPIEAVVARLLARPPAAAFGYVVTPNVDHFARLRRRPELAKLYHDALFCLLDSQALGHLCRLLGRRRPAVVTGADLTAMLLDRLRGRVAVIGLRPLEMAALRRRYPGIEFLHHAPPMGLLNDPEGFAAARDFGVAAGAPFLFIALGAPLQELLARAIAAQPGAVGIGLCVGSALRFRTGLFPRAPVWMRSAGLEWLYRLGQEPRRLAPRYLLAGPLVLLRLLLGV